MAKFSKGDKVVFIEDPGKHLSLTRYRTYEVVDIGDDERLRIQNDGDCVQAYNPKHFVLVPKLKVGDKVRIVRECSTKLGWPEQARIWISGMETAISADTVYTVKAVSAEFFQPEWVGVPNHAHWCGCFFPAVSAELVAEACKFKVGDRVKVVKKVEKDGDFFNWTNGMDNMVGKTFTIKEGVPRKNAWMLDNQYYFPESALELVESPKFKVGDKVRLVRKVTERSVDFDNVWISEMDLNIGKIGTISYIGNSGIRIKEFTDQCAYPPAGFELAVEEAPNPCAEIKVGDRVRVTIEVEVDAMDNHGKFVGKFLGPHGGLHHLGLNQNHNPVIIEAAKPKLKPKEGRIVHSVALGSKWSILWTDGEDRVLLLKKAGDSPTICKLSEFAGGYEITEA